MLKLIKPSIKYSDVEIEMKEIFESGWFTRGKFVEKFRESIKRYTGATHCFLTTSATTALTLCLKVLGVTAGDEVIISDYSFPATANVVEDLGAIPIFADVDLNTFNMLPNQVEEKITSKTKAVIFVDAFGNLSGIENIKSICEEHGIPLIEDAACAIGSASQGIKAGNLSDFTCFSFHPRKLLTTGEGGAITTNNEYYANLLEIKLNHGAINNNGTQDFIDYGYNYRLSEIQALMGLKQLNKLDDVVSERNKIKQKYISLLEEHDFVVQQCSKGIHHNVQSLVFRIPKGIEQAACIHYLKNQGVESTIGTYCLSATTYYKKKYENVQKNSLQLFNRSITLPCHPEVDVEQVSTYLTKLLKSTVNE